MGQENIWFWLGFLAFVAVLLSIDLGVLNRKAHAVSLKEAALMSVLWISIALLFGVFVTVVLGSRAGIEYYTAWVLEKSLSVDNLFVFVLIFSFFRVPAQYHHRVLFWGILGAIAMRAVLIVVGATLIQQFSWCSARFSSIPASSWPALDRMTSRRSTTTRCSKWPSASCASRRNITRRNFLSGCRVCCMPRRCCWC
jgi:TerC family integral membrane protein